MVFSDEAMVRSTEYLRYRSQIYIATRAERLEQPQERWSIHRSIVPGGFEPPSRAPKALMIGHYTMGLRFHFGVAIQLVLSVRHTQRAERSSHVAPPVHASMGLQRLGVLLFGIGLLLATVSAVTVGTTAGSTDARCVDHDPAYSLTAVDLTRLSVSYTNGCNTISVQPLIPAGGGLGVLGGLVSFAGIGRQRWNRSLDSTTD